MNNNMATNNNTVRGCPSIEIMDGQKRNDEMHNIILAWLTDENIEWAKGKELKNIIEHFGNKLEPIARLPHIIRENMPTIQSDYLYCGKAYLIDHHANHHPELDVNEYKFIQSILDSYDDIKDLSDNKKTKYAFIKKYGKSYAVIVEFSIKDSIILYKTFFYRDVRGKRLPYKGKKSIMEKWPVDGSTTISPIDLQQPADTENFSALDHFSSNKSSDNKREAQKKTKKGI